MADVTRSEQQVKLAADLYEARRAARFLLGDHYEASIAEWTRFIRLAMEREKKPPLSAMLVLTKIATEPMHHVFLMAAAVEVIEGSQ